MANSNISLAKRFQVFWRDDRNIKLTDEAWNFLLRAQKSAGDGPITMEMLKTALAPPVDIPLDKKKA